MKIIENEQPEVYLYRRWASIVVLPLLPNALTAESSTANGYQVKTLPIGATRLRLRLAPAGSGRRPVPPGAGECASGWHWQPGRGRQLFRVQPFRVAAMPDYGLEWFTVTEVVTVDFPPP